MCCASWCRRCQTPDTYAKAKQLCDEHGVPLEKVDIETPGSWAEFTESVTSVPTFIVLRDGWVTCTEEGRVTGTDMEGLGRLLRVMGRPEDA